MTKEQSIEKCLERFDELVSEGPHSRIHILSRRRYAPLVRERSRIAKILRAEGYSYPVIGEVMIRDHTSIMHLIRKGLE